MITVYTMQEKEQWDGIVRSFARHDVYYLSSYVKAFALHGDGEPLLFYFEKGNARAINVVIKRDIADCEYFSDIEQEKYFDLITPYGYGGWLIEGDCVDELQAEYETLCKELRIVSEFVRFHPVLDNRAELEKAYEETKLGSTVCMRTENEEEIWQNITSKNRNMIRKAEKNGVKICTGLTKDLIPPFIKIYNATMDKDCATAYYYFGEEFYESIVDDLKKNALWFYAKKGEEIIAMAIFLFANGGMHYHLSASRREYQGLAPTNLILYEAAKWASANGYKTLHLGGGVGAGEDSLYKFKKAFYRGEDASFYIGKKIFLPEVYTELVCRRKATDTEYDEHTNFFPAYRK